MYCTRKKNMKKRLKSGKLPRTRFLKMNHLALYEGTPNFREIAGSQIKKEF